VVTDNGSPQVRGTQVPRKGKRGGWVGEAICK
jgi:hypothetical protein